jgi:hypothetical protein
VTVRRLALVPALGLALLAAAPPPAFASPPSVAQRAEARAFVAADRRFSTRIEAVAKTLPKWDIAHACGGVLADARAPSGSVSLATFLGPQMVETMQRIDPASHELVADLARIHLRDRVLKSYLAWFRNAPLPVLDRYTAQPAVRSCTVYRHWRASGFKASFDWGADAKLDPALAAAALGYLGNGPPLNAPPALDRRVAARLIALGVPATVAHSLFK